METAHQAYAALVKAGLSPGFRARGWTGSGGRYQLPSETHWVLAGTQKSASSDRDEVRFTVNLLVVSRDDWSEIRDRRGAAALLHDIRQQRANAGDEPVNDSNDIDTPDDRRAHWAERPSEDADVRADITV